MLVRNSNANFMVYANLNGFQDAIDSTHRFENKRFHNNNNNNQRWMRAQKKE